MTQYAFGTGTLIAKRTDTANLPPFMFGVLQDITLDFDRKLEELYGQYNVAVALGDGALKISGKAKFARLQQTLFNNMLLGVSSATTTGLQMTSTGESFSPSAGSYTVTNSSKTPLEDFGVFYQSSGIQLTPVASGPSVGQYAFNASTGVYTFNTGDNSVLMWAYYTYTPASGVIDTVYANQLMGSAPVFEVFFKSSVPNFGVAKDITFKLNACKSSKLALGFNNQKFVIPEFDFQAFADASNNVMTITTTE